jgi:hypothetical protein
VSLPTAERGYLGVLELSGVDGDVLELLGVEVDGELSELLGLEVDGGVLALGAVGEVEVVGELGPGGDVEDDGVFDLTELRVFGCVELCGEVDDDELLLFGVDCAPGAIDMRGPRCAAFDDELDGLEELLEDD